MANQIIRCLIDPELVVCCINNNGCTHEFEADRFPSINDADLDALLEAREANNTKNVIKYGLRILRDFCVQREILFEEFEQSTKEEMCETLKAFYAAMRSKKGEYYSK